MNPLKKGKRKLKRKIANSTGIPTTKSGRNRKTDALKSQAIIWILVIAAIVYFSSGV